MKHMKTTLPPAPRSVSLLADILLAKHAKERQEKVEAYRPHVNRMNLLGGHRKPLVMHIKGEVENRGVRWTQHKHTTAVLAGAI